MTPDDLRAMAERLEAEAVKLREEAARRDDPGKFSVVERISTLLNDNPGSKVVTQGGIAWILE